MSELTERLRKVEMYGDFLEGKGWSRAYPSPIQIEAADALEAQQAKVEELKDKIDGLQSDLDNAVETAVNRGAIEWGRLNYPKHPSVQALTPSLPK